MSKLSFKTFCIENYAELKHRDSTEVYAQFETSGFLSLLDSDYEDLHGMDFEYMIK